MQSSTGIQALPPWQEDSASKALDVKTACRRVKIDQLDQLSVWGLATLLFKKAVQAASFCFIERSLHSVQRV